MIRKLVIKEQTLGIIENHSGTYQGIIENHSGNGHKKTV